MLYPEGVKVIAKADSAEEISDGGIIMPFIDKRQVEITTGTIISIGPKADATFAEGADGVVKRQVKLGDRVIYARYGGAELKIKAKSGELVPLRVLNDEDVIIYDDEEEWDI